MVEIPDRRMGADFDLPPMPPHASATDVLKRALPSLAPSMRMAVVDAAEKFMKVNAAGRWVDFDRMVTPYAVEPANVMSSRIYREMIFAGPARAGKTVILLQGANHAITCDPGVVHVVHMTETTARQWVDEELEPMIRNSPDLAARQGSGKSDRNRFDKKFLGGTKLTVGWPVIGQLSGRTIRLIMLTDFDRFPLSIGGEGSAFALAGKRTETLGSRGMAAAESSPGHPIKDPEFRPSTPHEAPPCEGILDLYNGGTRARWYWECRDCGGAFEPRFDRLLYDRDLSPANAGETAEMQCPHCGSLTAHRHKAELNRAGYWLHETETGELARLESGLVKKTQRVSYWLNGAAASFAPWSRLVSKYETARRTFETLQDEEPLKVTVNTDQGAPYLPKAMVEGGQVTLDDLKGQLRELPQKIAPSWARFVTFGVDVQKGRFVCMAMAWGVKGERIVIDRFDLHEPPATAPRADDRGLDPAKYSEDWDALLDLVEIVYPVDGADYGLKPMAVACDFHGEPGVSDNATKFWQARRAARDVSRWFVVRGHGGFKVDGRVWFKAPTRASDGKKVRSIKLLNLATDKLKDSLFAALGRPDGGPGSQHVAGWMTEDHLKEFTAEYRKPSGYAKRKNMPRNESIDLAIYNLGLAEHKGAGTIDWDRPPRWAASGPSNENAVPLSKDPEDPPQVRNAKKAPPRKISWLEN